MAEDHRTGSQRTGTITIETTKCPLRTPREANVEGQRSVQARKDQRPQGKNVTRSRKNNFSNKVQPLDSHSFSPCLLVDQQQRARRWAPHFVASMVVGVLLRRATPTLVRVVHRGTRALGGKPAVASPILLKTQEAADTPAGQEVGGVQITTSAFTSRPRTGGHGP